MEEHFNAALGALTEAADTIEKREQLELFNQEEFAQTLLTSVSAFSDSIEKNSLLSAEDKKSIYERTDREISQILDAFLTDITAAVETRDPEDLKVKWHDLQTESTALMHSLFADVESSLQSGKVEVGGLSSEAYAELLTKITEREMLSLHDIRPTQDLHFMQRSYVPEDSATLWKYNLDGEAIYIKRVSENNALVFAATEPPTVFSIDAQTLDNQSLKEAFVQARQSVESTNKQRSVARYNLQSALRGDVESLHRIELDVREFDESERLALDSAYNMGVKGALQAKMQLLMSQLYEKRGWPLPEKFSLDGSWGVVSEQALAKLLPNEANFNGLIELYKKEYGVQQVDLFLTAQETQDPRYHFDNKGVFRGPKVAVLKERLIKENFDIEAIVRKGIDGHEVSVEVVVAFPRVKAVLDKLTADADIKGSILATMLLEKGISTWKDRIGIGRGDQKEYAYAISKKYPRIAAVWNKQMPACVGITIGITSAGIMQVNFETARDIIEENTHEYWPEDKIISTLHESIEFSTVMAYLVYGRNAEQIKKVKENFGSTDQILASR